VTSFFFLVHPVELGGGRLDLRCRSEDVLAGVDLLSPGETCKHVRVTVPVDRART
jgi:hypothetical protein